MGMTKLIYSADFDPTVGVGAELITRQGELTKQASTIFGKEYSDLKPDDRHVGIHVVALGDAEHYGMNRNGDLFTKKACVEYYPTFVENGHVFRHHRNKDPSGAIGEIKYAAYNEPMGRIELFIHADKEKAAPELERLEKEGEIPFSMACRVPNDRCTICGALRKHAGDESECEHVRDHLGEQWEDGRKVGTYNDEPQFFDISFVGRPADRIAWNLKVASALPLSSVKEAEYAGIKVPDSIACDTEESKRKLGYAKDVASLQASYRGWISKSASVVTARDGYLYELRRVPSSSLDDDTVSRLRELPTKMAFAVLADTGVIMDMPTFFKYATGDDYVPVVKPYMEETVAYYPTFLENAVKQGSASSFCTRTDFDAEGYRPRVKVELQAALEKAATLNQIPQTAVDLSGVDESFNLVVDKNPKTLSNINVVEKLAETYAGYQMSAIDAVLTRRSGETRNKLDVEAVASANNVKTKRV